jgi:hypothetical protein
MYESINGRPVKLNHRKVKIFLKKILKRETAEKIRPGERTLAKIKKHTMATEMHIEKKVIVNRPRREVLDYLKHIRNQDHFSVWNLKDPQKKVSTSGTDGSKGFIYTWDSEDKSVGAGTQEIKNIIDGQSIDCRIAFERPMKNVADVKFAVKELKAAQTEVSWEFRGPMKFPMSLFAFIFKRMLGKDMDQSLQNLKKQLEK